MCRGNAYAPRGSARLRDHPQTVYRIVVCIVIVSEQAAARIFFACVLQQTPCKPRGRRTQAVDCSPLPRPWLCSRLHFQERGQPCRFVICVFVCTGLCVWVCVDGFVCASLVSRPLFASQHFFSNPWAAYETMTWAAACKSQPSALKKPLRTHRWCTSRSTMAPRRAATAACSAVPPRGPCTGALDRKLGSAPASSSACGRVSCIGYFCRRVIVQ